MRNMILMSFVVLLSACGSLGHRFDILQKPASDEALIYYYRPSKFFGQGMYYDVEENKNIDSGSLASCRTARCSERV